MDTNLLIEVHQYYINSLKNKIEALKSDQSVQDNSVAAKCINVYISNLSCIDNNVDIFNNADTNITHTSTKTKSPTSTNSLPFITYTFSNEISIKKIIIKRPDCTNMLNACIKVFDNNNNCTYESVVIQQAQSANQYYTYTIPNRDPNIQ